MINKNILDLLFKEKLTSQQFAKKLGISPGVVSHWITGRTIPNIRHVKLICETFNVDANWLLDVHH